MATGKLGTLSVLTIESALSRDRWTSSYLIAHETARARRVLFFEEAQRSIFVSREDAAQQALQRGLQRAAEIHIAEPTHAQVDAPMPRRGMLHAEEPAGSPQRLNV